MVYRPVVPEIVFLSQEARVFFELFFLSSAMEKNVITTETDTLWVNPTEIMANRIQITSFRVNFGFKVNQYFIKVNSWWFYFTSKQTDMIVQPSACAIFQWTKWFNLQIPLEVWCWCCCYLRLKDGNYRWNWYFHAVRLFASFLCCKIACCVISQGNVIPQTNRCES